MANLNDRLHIGEPWNLSFNLLKMNSIASGPSGSFILHTSRRSDADIDMAIQIDPFFFRPGGINFFVKMASHIIFKKKKDSLNHKKDNNDYSIFKEQELRS